MGICTVSICSAKFLLVMYPFPLFTYFNFLHAIMLDLQHVLSYLRPAKDG